MPEKPNVFFSLYSLNTNNAVNLLPPEGAMIFQGAGFPRDIADVTCIPHGIVSFHNKTGITGLDAQWYKPLPEIAREEISPTIDTTVKVKAYLCHGLRKDVHSYPVSLLALGGNVQQGIWHPTAFGSMIHYIEYLNKTVRFTRLGHVVELDLNDVKDDQRFTLVAEWSYDYIELRATWVDGQGLDKYYSGEGVLIEQFGTYQPPNVGTVVQRRKRTEFDSTLIPAQVAKAIWEEAKNHLPPTPESSTDRAHVGVPRREYQDQHDFQATVLAVISEIQGILSKAKPSAFWNGRNPKSEPDAGSSLRFFLEAICAYKNIKIYQEDPSRSGNIDFVFSGISAQFEHVSVVLEIKNAHNPKLKEGLTNQLPQYIIERHEKCGIFGVLWYKGMHFAKPKDESMIVLKSRLLALKPAIVADVVVLDVSYHVSASKL